MHKVQKKSDDVTRWRYTAIWKRDAKHTHDGAERAPTTKKVPRLPKPR